MLLIVLALLAGLVLLSRAADEFVTGAARIAVNLKISPIVVGALLVGFGTSAPEMLVSGIAAVEGDDDLGIGNIIGSNLSNLSLILGSAALLIPLSIDSRILRREAPMATGAVIIFAVLVQGGISQTEGFILLAGMIGAMAILLMGSGEGSESIAGEVGEIAEEAAGLGAEALRTILGLVGTVGGAWLLVYGATGLADELGINEGFVGVTLVAIGTSLPELVTSVAAARQKQTDLIVGNLLGSNIFNSFAVGAVVGLLGDGSIDDPSLTGLDLWYMLAICILAAIAMYTKGVFEKFEGGILLGLFVGFLIATWWNETNSDAPVGMVMNSPAMDVVRTLFATLPG